MNAAYPLVLACALPLSLCAQGEVKVTGAKVTEFGIYKAQLVSSTTNGAGVKFQRIDEFTLLKNTTRIPARLGIRFGFRYEIFGTPSNAPVTLTMIAKHPPLKNPLTGTTESATTYQVKTSIGKTYTANSLDDESDLVPGLWIFELWYQGKMLCDQSFMVVRDVNEKDSAKQAPAP